MSAKALEIINVKKSYSLKAMNLTSASQFRSFISVLTGRGDRSVVALDGVSFDVEEGEVFGILGPNGAGKTTLIKILSTLIIPDSGKALVYGYDVVEKPRKVLSLLQAVLAEGVGFERRLSARRNLEFYATLYDIPKDEAKRRISEVLDFCGLQDKADLMFQKLSTGNVRKLLVSRALLSNARVLLFDEPTASLDPVSAIEFRQLIADLARKGGKTVVIATHNLAEAQAICDRIVVFHKGKVVTLGRPDEIKKLFAEQVKLTVRLSLKDGNSDDFRSRLNSIDGVSRCDTLLDGGDMIVDIVGEADMNYNELLSTLLAGSTIKHLETHEPSLEEAFIRLIKEKG
ncbi:MAG: ABC transporter ATP-binding protein [Conexivisphaerales archaeon]